MKVTSAKILADAKKVKIAFTRENGRDAEIVPNFSSADVPAKSFIKAMRDLHGDFCFIMELPKKLHDKVSVHGVSFGKKGGQDTYTILGGLKVDAGYSSLNTPTMIAPSEDSTGVAATLTGEQVGRLEAFRAEAVQYVEGQRSQTELGLDAEPEATAEEPAEEPVAAEA